jgi:hypothetical protein
VDVPGDDVPAGIDQPRRDERLGRIAGRLRSGSGRIGLVVRHRRIVASSGRPTIDRRFARGYPLSRPERATFPPARA